MASIFLVADPIRVFFLKQKNSFPVRCLNRVLFDFLARNALWRYASNSSLIRHWSGYLRTELC